ncbi:MAG: mechanosensitive ion channel family protein [Clostridiales bacterium]|jgi:small conductance mechanosensitive channel|nr:mechanosensitive ion channel family protein [Clostridiales bacterium]
MKNIWESVLDFFAKASADLALKAVVAALLLIIGNKLIGWASFLFGKSLSKSKLEKGVQGFLENLATISLRVMLVISLLVYLGVPAASFIAILTSAGLAIGLALQGSLSNFAGGLMILFFKPFKVGDFIKTDNADGTVLNISIMYTTLKTLDGKKVVIPNAMLSNGVVTDFSWFPTRRIDISFTTTLLTDSKQVCRLLEDVANAHEDVLKDPLPAASLDDFQNGTLSFTLRCWAQTSKWWATKLALTTAIKQALEANNISLSGPVMELRQN